MSSTTTIHFVFHAQLMRVSIKLMAWLAHMGLPINGVDVKLCTWKWRGKIHTTGIAFPK